MSRTSEGPKFRATPIIGLIRRSDFVLIIADARYPEMSRSTKLEKRIKEEGRRFAIIFNKIDLITYEARCELKIEYPDAFMVSTRTRRGFAKLRDFLYRLANKKEITVGIIGFPNTGKSSIINIMKGSRAARTSARAGFTTGIQRIRVSPYVMMWDSPGVTPFGTDETRLALLGAKNPELLKDPETVAISIITKLRKENPGALAQRYGADENASAHDILIAIARKTGKLQKGGEPDPERAVQTIINDWQRDKFSK